MTPADTTSSHLVINVVLTTGWPASDSIINAAKITRSRNGSGKKSKFQKEVIFQTHTFILRCKRRVGINNKGQFLSLEFSFLNTFPANINHPTQS